MCVCLYLFGFPFFVPFASINYDDVDSKKCLHGSSMGIMWSIDVILV